MLPLKTASISMPQESVMKVMEARLGLVGEIKEEVKHGEAESALDSLLARRIPAYTE